jgi:hypothetical protein
VNRDDPSALVAAFLHALAERERRHDHPETLQAFKLAYQPLAQAVDLAAQNRSLHELTKALTSTESNWAFGSIATMCGVLVERGGDPTIALEPILDRLTVQLGRVPEFMTVMQQQLGIEQPNRVLPDDWQTHAEAHPDHAWVIGEWFALNFVGGAAMTMLCRDVEARKRARQRIDLIHAAESARSDQPYAYYLAELLGMVDDERLLVLDTTQSIGYRVRLTAVRNNFHLFTLLQAALLPGDARLNRLAVAIAKSERMLAEVSAADWAEVGDHDIALWSFNTWMVNAEPSSWIWGEMKPTEIPLLAGERIVLLGSLDVPRSWEVAYFVPLHSALRCSVQIEETLSTVEYAEWMERIRAAAKV